MPVVVFDADGNMSVRTKDPMLKKLIFDCRDSKDGLELFAKFFLNDRTMPGATKKKRRSGSFSKPFTEHRKEYAQRISDTRIPFQWGMAHRSFGKTTLVWAEQIRRLCFRLSTFILFCTSELALAERRTESVKQALITNPRIRKYFGVMTPSYMDGMREVFGAKAWKLADPITNEPFAIVVPKSNGTTVNGLVEYVGGRQVRPDLIVTDDITDRLRVNDEFYRASLADWYFGTLLPCVENEEQPDAKTNRWKVNRGERVPWQVILTDTYKHSDALIETVSQEPDWVGRRYPLCEETEQGSGIVVSMVEYMDDAQVQSMYDRHKRIGQEDRFFREYVCRAGFSSDNKFPTLHQYYSESDEDLNVNPLCTRFLVMDPARSKNPKSSFTAILSVAVDCLHAKVWLRRLVHEHLSHEEMKVRLFELSVEQNAQIICVEDAGLNDHIQGPLERYFSSRGRYAEWVWLPTSRRNIQAEGEYRDIKECRASAALWLYRPLQPTHPQGHVWHEECIRNSVLEQQQRSFPDCKRWDAMDTLGHVDYVMRRLGLVFEEQTVVQKGYRTNLDEWDEILNGEYQMRLLA